MVVRTLSEGFLWNCAARIDEASMCARSVLAPSAREFGMKTALIASLLLVCSTFMPVSAAENGSSFDKTVTDLANLSQSSEVTRAELLEVTRAFMRIYRKPGDRKTANRALLYAGKASLEVYRRSGNPEDLDRAIRCFRYVTRLHRAGPDRSEAAKELRSAVAVRAEGRFPQTGDSKSPLAASVSFPEGKGRSDKAGRHDSEAHANPPKPSSAADTLSPSRASFSAGPWGNPFCPPGGIMAVSIPLPERRRSAIQVPAVRVSIPAQTVTDYPSVRSTSKPHEKKFLVVVDPGHGGKDPGTVSPDGRLKEKDVTLRVAELFKEILHQTHPKISAVLTRDDDRYLSLGERAALANALDADLFISIHCNASTESSSRGIETYYLSPASSRRALAVAARENDIPLGKMNKLEAALLDLTIASRIAESEKFAGFIQKSIFDKLEPRVSSSTDRGVRSAPLSVLSGVRMPAVLLECAFMSNQQDRRNLGNLGHLQRLSEGIAQGISLYAQDLDRKASLSLSARKGD